MKACVTYAKRGINLITMNFTFMARSKVQNLQISTDILFFFFFNFKDVDIVSRIPQTHID